MLNHTWIEKCKVYRTREMQMKVMWNGYLKISPCTKLQDSEVQPVWILKTYEFKNGEKFKQPKQKLQSTPNISDIAQMKLPDTTHGPRTTLLISTTRSHFNCHNKTITRACHSDQRAPCSSFTASCCIAIKLFLLFLKCRMFREMWGRS